MPRPPSARDKAKTKKAQARRKKSTPVTEDDGHVEEELAESYAMADEPYEAVDEADELDERDEPFDSGEPIDEESRGRWWQREEPGKPRPVVGGLTARSRTGGIGTTWWSRRFLASLEATMIGGRVDRGRSYARKGQVVELRIEAGVVAARVQGSREEPYAVHLRMVEVPAEDWDRIVDVLAGRAGYAARMLAGELPREVEEVFESEGASLLPAPHAPLRTECTCPDWENPCKHIAAVCYLVAEEFDRDPFSLLTWRGRAKEDVLAELRARRREAAGTAPVPDVPAAMAETEPAVPDVSDVPEAERDLLARFWGAGPEITRVRIHPEQAPVPTAALRLAPRGAITVRGGDLVDVLAPVYRRITAAAAARARS